jgi:transcription elongation factor SPT5
MVRVTHGKFTKAVSKKMRPAEEEESEEEEADSEEEEYKDSEDDGDDDDDASEEDDDEDDEKDELDESKGDAKKTQKTRKRNKFVDDVAEEEEEEEEDSESDSDEAPKKKQKKSSKADGKDKKSRGKSLVKEKKKGVGAAAFIDDIAEVEDDDEISDDEGDELDGEEHLDDGEREAVELEAQQRIHARYQNMENMERLENEEELEKRLKERYAANRDWYEGDGIADQVDQQALHPTVRDPKLWMVTVKQGKERETVVCLMQKAINSHKTGKGALAIKSASAQDHLKSYIYVEAEREDHVKKALQGMRHVYHMRPIRLVPIKEMVDSITVTKKKVENVVVGSWVRMRGGVYKGDLARVVDANYADNQCTVKLVPRFDYAHMRAKEEGTASGRSKKDSNMRPPARLFTEAEARKYHLTFERGRQDRRMGDVVDMLCGQHKLKDGYHVKTISFVSCKLAETPALDELQRYAAGEEATEAAGQGAGQGAGASAAEANLEALAASLGDGAGGQRDFNFRPGDQVVIVQGDLKNLAGVVERVNADGSVKIMPQHEMLHEALDIDRDHLRKSFKLGSHVRCVHGRHEGEAGLVVKVEGEVATVFSDVSKEEFVVFSHHLADSAEASRRVESVGEYGTHDLAMLEDGSVGMVVRVEKDAAVLMMQTSSAERPDVRPVRLHDMRRKLNTRNLSAVDGSMETVEIGSMCRVHDGPGKGLTLTVVHIWKGVVWGKARDVSEHGGIVVVRARDCRAHGSSGRRNDAPSESLGFGAPPRSPGAALLRSPSRGGSVPEHQSVPRSGAFGGGRVGRRADDLIGTTARVVSGVYKGYRGKIVDATETTVRVELEAQARTVTVQRSQLAGRERETKPENAYEPADGIGIGFGRGSGAYDFPGGGLPSLASRTPLRSGVGSATPVRDDAAGGRTPLHASAWNPTTPAYDSSAWSASPADFGVSRTPGGYSGAPGAGAPGTPGAGYGGTPAGDADADADAGYDGKFVSNAVVVLPDKRQGVLKRRDGADATVVLGTTKTLANGDERLESLEQNVVTTSLATLSLAKPQKKDRVRVVSGEDNFGATAELIGVDGADGVIKLDATKDISIHEIGALARIWVG